MHDQPKFVPQRGTAFFADGRSARPQVENTVARGQLHEDSYFYTGMINGKEGDALPFAVTPELIARGQERYNVYCTPCHSRVGNGAGMIVQRGYRPAGNFHTARLEAAPLGHFFDVMTNGYGSMPDYSAQLTPADRWAVVAYIKALQLSQNAKPSDVASGAKVEPLARSPKRKASPKVLQKTGVSRRLRSTARRITRTTESPGRVQAAHPPHRSQLPNPQPLQHLWRKRSSNGTNDSRFSNEGLNTWHLDTNNTGNTGTQPIMAHAPSRRC